MFKLLFLLPLIALIDPVVLIWLWPRLSLWEELGGLIVYPLLLTFFARRGGSEHSFLLGSIRNIARIMAWYPGPISKILSFILVLPPTEAALHRWAAAKLQQHVLRGMGAQFPNGTQPGGAQSGTPSKPAPERDEHGLKKTRGRVID